MPTVAPSGGGVHAATVNNNGGTILNAGNVYHDDPTSNPLTIADIAGPGNHPTGGQVHEISGHSGAGVTKAVRDGNFAHYPEPSEDRSGEFILRGYTTEINGRENDILASPGADINGTRKSGSQPINSVRKIGVKPTYNIFAGSDGVNTNPNFVAGSGAGEEHTFVSPTGSGVDPALDRAGSPTKAVPGELTYFFGGALPQKTAYQPRDSHSNE